MKRFGSICVSMLLSAPAAAGTIDNTFSNTVVVTDAKGVKGFWFYNADGTYTMKTDTGQAGSGKWRLAGKDICWTADPQQGQPAPAEICSAYTDGKNVGDEWTSKDKNGDTITIRIVAGR